MIGETVIVEADVFTDGHETLGVELLVAELPTEKTGARLPMQP